MVRHRVARGRPIFEPAECYQTRFLVPEVVDEVRRTTFMYRLSMMGRARFRSRKSLLSQYRWCS